MNAAQESNSSNVVRLAFDKNAMIDGVEDLRVVEKSEHSVTISWKKMAHVDGYYVNPKVGTFYPKMNKAKTLDSKITGIETVLD
jgi:hypothetical protein